MGRRDILQRNVGQQCQGNSSSSVYLCGEVGHKVSGCPKIVQENGKIKVEEIVTENPYWKGTLQFNAKPPIIMSISLKEMAQESKEHLTAKELNQRIEERIVVFSSLEAEWMPKSEKYYERVRKSDC